MLFLLLIIFSPSALTKMGPSTHTIDQCYRNTHTSIILCQCSQNAVRLFFEHLPSCEVYGRNPSKVITVLFFISIGLYLTFYDDSGRVWLYFNFGCKSMKLNIKFWNRKFDIYFGLSLAIAAGLSFC